MEKAPIETTPYANPVAGDMRLKSQSSAPMKLNADIPKSSEEGSGSLSRASEGKVVAKPSIATSINQSSSTNINNFGRNIVQNIIQYQQDSIPSSSKLNDVSIIKKSKSVSEKSGSQSQNVQELPKQHTTIEAMIATPNDGDMLSKHSIVSSARLSNKNEDDDRNSYSDQSQVEIQSNPNENADVDILSKRPRIEKRSDKNRRSLRKHSVKSVSHQKSATNQVSRDLYYPGVVLAPLKSQKSEPSRKYREAQRDKRNLSLPDINRSKLKKANSNLNYSNVQKSISNYSSKHLKHVKNREVGQSFVSFNVKNSSIKNNTTLIPGNKPTNLLENSNFSANMTENQAKQIRESFESCTTEGKKTSTVPADMTSNKIAEEAYGNPRGSSKLDSRNQKPSTKENASKTRRSKSQLSNVKSESIGEDSLPEIANSVVEDSLPFRGLENHYKVISKEGFSGANDTNYMQKTNENFYSSFKSKQNDNTVYKHNGFPQISKTDLNRTELFEENSDLDRLNYRTVNHQKSISSSPGNQHTINIIKSNTNQQKSKGTITVNKNSKNQQLSKLRKANRSKASNPNNDQAWFSYELTSKNGKLNPKTDKLMSQKFKELDSDIEKLEQNESIFNEGQKLKRGLIDVNKTYDHLKSYRKVNRNKTTRQSVNKDKDKKWGDVMQFLENNPNVLMDMIPDEGRISEPNNERNRHGISNYRVLTGITAPGRGKQHPFSKPNDVIAPWKIGKRNKILNKDIELHIDKRAKNISSKQKQSLPTNVTNNASVVASIKAEDKQKVKIPKITNRDGLNSQPAAPASSNLANKMISRNEVTKPSINTVKQGGFKIHQTPSFLSPHASQLTEQIPSMSQSTYSKDSSQFGNNKGSSMLEKHTIIFESETEYVDGQSDAPTESQIIQRKHTINFESSSAIDELTPKENNMLNIVRKDEPIVNQIELTRVVANNSKNLATFRNGKIKSQSDIYHDDVNLDDYYDDARAAKTALNQSRIAANQSRVVVNHVHVAKDQENAASVSKSNSFSKPHHILVDRNIQAQLDKEDLSPSEKEKLNDEIYLNTNSAEENPYLVDDEIKDSVSISKHTL